MGEPIHTGYLGLEGARTCETVWIEVRPGVLAPECHELHDLPEPSVTLGLLVGAGVVAVMWRKR